ncbi:protein kinase 1, putative [Plasmodium vinckei]|uniref:Protein kinase 1, putative n=1 Tax=Plasmodium vinckei TaxID=5860 RepID=A0A6V7SRE0_PLAVN|nr:protein kinase 1, putative [Plasmodium vinckei]
MDLIKIYKENDILNDYTNIYFDDENLKIDNKNLTYKISHIIGNGVYGVVYKADCLENSSVVALKQTYQKSTKHFKEIEIMKKLKHPNIVKLKHAFYTLCPNGGVYVHMVMEYGNTDLATSLYYITIKNSEHVNKTFKNANNSKHIKNDKDNDAKLKNDCTKFNASGENNKCVNNKQTDNNDNINSVSESENKENPDKSQMNKCDENCTNTPDPNYNDTTKNMNKSENKCNEKNIDTNSYNNSEKEINTSNNNNNIKSENDCLNNYGNIINNFNINMLQENINNICSCHNLSDYIKKSFFNENQVKIYLYQLIRATLYLHSLCITHRDIKPQNILIFLNKPNNNNYENESQENKKCVVCIHNSVKFKCIMNKRNMKKNLDENNNSVNIHNSIVNNDCNNNEHVINNTNTSPNEGSEKCHKNNTPKLNNTEENNDINKESYNYNCSSTPICMLNEKKNNSNTKHVREKRSMSFSNTYKEKNNDNENSDYLDNANKDNYKKALKRSKTDLVVSLQMSQTNTIDDEKKEILPLSDDNKNSIDSCEDKKEKNEITNSNNEELDNIYDEKNLDKIYMNSIVYKYIKLCDFNTSTKLKENYKYLSYVCSRYYRAPELLFGSNYYSHAIDTWSIGCVMGELILGKPLFLGDCASDQLVEIIKILGTPNDEDFLSFRSVYKNVKFPNIKPITLKKLISNNSSKESIDLLDKLLQFNPKKRIKLCSALLHNYFDDIRNFKVFNTNIGSDKTNYTLPYITNCFNFTKEELLHYTVEERKILIPSEIRKHKLGEVTQYIDMTLDHFNQLYPNKVNLTG